MFVCITYVIILYYVRVSSCKCTHFCVIWQQQKKGKQLSLHRNVENQENPFPKIANQFHSFIIWCSMNRPGERTPFFPVLSLKHLRQRILSSFMWIIMNLTYSCLLEDPNHIIYILESARPGKWFYCFTNTLVKRDICPTQRDVISS